MGHLVCPIKLNLAPYIKIVTLMYKITKNRWDNTCDSLKKIENNQKLILFKNTSSPRFSWMPVEIGDFEISPIRGCEADQKPWEGSCKIKPWEHKVTVAIPCLGTPEIVKLTIELLQLQSIKPYIMIIDTGSIGQEREEIETLRTDNVEVHLIQLHGVRHPSDYPAMAMDLAFTLCRSEYLFATHADCFLRKVTLLEDLINLCKTKSPVVGYQLSPRSHKDWVGMVSHTATMYHVPSMDKIGFAWSLRRLCNEFDIVDYNPSPDRPNWPDTEILGNYILRKNKIVPHLIGSEENNERTLDENIDHFRSFTSGKLYSKAYFSRVQKAYEDAKKQAINRIKEWKKFQKNN